MNDAQEILRALDLPPEAVPLFLEHIARFCHDHGGARHYAELLELVARYQRTQ
jgi:hypothetical protein